VGTVAPQRIASFKRTSKYDVAAFQLLTGILSRAQSIATHEEIVVSGRAAVSESSFQRLGLTDAAIHSAAKKRTLLVLTDDLNLWVSLQNAGIEARNFSYMLAASL
jgi:hypothetical protein